MVSESLEIAPGLKLADIKHCGICHKGVMHDGSNTFLRVSVERFIIDSNAVQRAHGLEVMLGGRGDIAQAMGLDEDLAKLMDANMQMIVCTDCAMTKHSDLYFMLLCKTEEMPA